MGYTVTLSKKVDLNVAVPNASACNTGYCLVGGGEYLVYNSANSTTTVNNLPAGTYSYQFMNTSTGALSATYVQTTKTSANFSPTSGKPATSHVLYVKKN
jgi:hypothetical protein